MLSDLWQLIRQAFLLAAFYGVGMRAGRSEAVEAERNAMGQRQDDQAELDRLSRPELLERVRETRDRLRAVRLRRAGGR